ncbi:MAG: deoxyribonuclease IV [bacterium]
MYFVGPHVSIGGGVENAPINAKGLGATGFGMFVKNQRQWTAAPYAASTQAAFKAQMKADGYTAAQVMPHAGYLINLANPDAAAHAKSMAALLDELRRCAALGLDKLNLHPGSHLRLITPKEACERVAKSINTALSETVGVTVVIENTAGSGGNLGSTFEEIRAMIDGVEDKTRIGVCLDTMHAFAAGYDIRKRDGFLKTMEHFTQTVGMHYLRGMHLNDSKVAFNSHVDRHESLGAGLLGIDVFKCIMRDARFEAMPLVLETPNEELWGKELQQLTEMAEN